MIAEAEPALEKRDIREHVPSIVIAVLGAVLLLVANTAGAGDFRWRFPLYFALILLMSISLLYAFARRNKYPFSRTFLLALSIFAALIVLSALSLIWGSNFYGGIQGLLLLGSFAVAFTLGYLVLRRRDDVWLFMGLVTAVSVSLCVWGLWQYFFGFSELILFLGKHGINYVITDRVNSNFITPNVLACFLNIAIPIGVALVLIEKRRILTYIWGAALALQLVCLYLTQSRGGWLIFGAVLVLLVFLIPRPKWKWRWKILAVVLVIAVCASFLCSLYSPLGDAGDEGVKAGASGEEYSGLDITAAAGSIRGRVGIWRGGLDMFSHNLAGGVGVGSFGLAMQRYQYRAYYSARAHNYLLETGAETGIIGLLLLLVLSILVLSRIRGVFRRKLKGDARVIAVALWALAAGFLLHNMIDIAWYNPLTAAVFWLCVGGLFALVDTGFEEDEVEGAGEAGDGGGGVEEDQSPMLPEKGRVALFSVLAILLAVVVILAGYLLTMYFLAETHKEKADDHESIGEVFQAIDEYERALDLFETDPGAHLRLGYIYLMLYASGEEIPPAEECAEESLAHLDRAVELEPENSFAHMWRGIMLLHLEDFEEGRSSLEEAQRLYPHNPTAFYYEGEACLNEGKPKEAVEKYKEAVALLPFYADQSIVPFKGRPEFDFIMRSLGKLAEIMVSEGESSEFLDIIDQALVELPGNAYLYYLKGWALEQMGDLEGALAEFQAVIEINPKAPGIHLEMGRIYRQMGEVEMAEREFLLELELNPESEQALEELESLAGGE